MCVAFDELDDLLFLLFLPPFLEGFQVVEDQGVAVVHVTGPIGATLSTPRGSILDGVSGA